MHRERKNIRLKGYDYSKSGAYFVTMNVRNRLNLFGEIRDGKMHLNAAGEMVEELYNELSHKFPSVWSGPYVVMPDHFHAIVIIHNGTEPVPEFIPEAAIPMIAAELDLTVLPSKDNPFLAEVIQWFKTMTTNYYIQGVKVADWPRFDRQLWQRGYYDRIIRSELAFINVTNYIICNPEKAV